MGPRNEAVLRYLEVERVAPPDTNSAWVVDGYSLSTHPKLCDRVKELNRGQRRHRRVRRRDVRFEYPDIERAAHQLHEMMETRVKV